MDPATAEEVTVASGRPAARSCVLMLAWVSRDTARPAAAASGMLITASTATPPVAAASRRRRAARKDRATRQASALGRPAETTRDSRTDCWAEALKSARLMGRVREILTCSAQHDSAGFVLLRSHSRAATSLKATRVNSRMMRSHTLLQPLSLNVAVVVGMYVARM
jgi:hypothetical protein